MIIHHLFYLSPNLGFMIGQYSLEYRIAMFGKICVTMFLLLSGIGLSISAKNINWKDLYAFKLLKLYLNYFFIVIVTIIITIPFYKDFPDIYINLPLGIFRILISMTGLQYLIANMGINITWWFMTIIICAYILFPIIKNSIIKYNTLILLLSIIIIPCLLIKIPHLACFQIISWLSPFIIGVYLEQTGLLSKTIKYARNNNIFKTSVYILLTCSILCRLFFLLSYSISTRYIDIIITILIILIVGINHKNKTNQNFLIKKELIYLGNISMDLYFIHYLIIGHISKSFIYSMPYTIIMFIYVLLMSIIGHYILSFIRHKISFDDIIKKASLIFRNILSTNK